MRVRILTRRSEERYQQFVDKCVSTIFAQEVRLYDAEQENAELKRILLASYKATRDLAEGMRVANAEEIDVSEDLDLLVTELSDQISLLEEHHVVL